MNKLLINTTQKEEKLNNDITEYIIQINDLTNKMETFNNIIKLSTDEKENNEIRITNLLYENEKIKQNSKNNSIEIIIIQLIFKVVIILFFIKIKNFQKYFKFKRRK